MHVAVHRGHLHHGLLRLAVVEGLDGLEDGPQDRDRVLHHRVEDLGDLVFGRQLVLQPVEQLEVLVLDPLEWTLGHVSRLYFDHQEVLEPVHELRVAHEFEQTAADEAVVALFETTFEFGFERLVCSAGFYQSFYFLFAQIQILSQCS